VINVVILVLLFFFGLTYLDPPPENGIAVNFGTSEVGSGNQQPTKPMKSTPKKNTTPPPQESNSSPEETSPELNDEVVTQKNDQAPVVKDKKKTETKPEAKEKEEKKEEKKTEEEKETKEQPKEQPKETKPEKKPDPKPDESTSNALNSIMNGPDKDGEAQEGEGNDNQAGDKGKEDGDPNASSYYGNGSGNQGNENYRLDGREALKKKKFVQDCNESGIVVVQIQVNQNGEVVKANPGAKGTTNSSACLMKPAKKAALQTTFNQDADAPALQTGTIVYEFRLSE
jgi:hypothetical protein